MDNRSTPLPPPERPGTPARDAVSAVVVAGDAGSTIAATLTSILGQTLPPQRVVVVVAGSRDDTFAVARTFNGRHERALPGADPARTTVTVIDRGPREGSLRSAYGFALRLVGDAGRVLLVSPDAELQPDVLELLTAALDRDPGAGSVSASLDPRPSGSHGPLAGALRLLQRHWAMGAVETGTDLGLTGPVPLAPASLLRLPEHDPGSSSAGTSEGILTDLLAGDDRSVLVPGARARVDTSVTWGTMRERRDRWGAHVARLARGGSSADVGDRRRARLASLRIGVGPVLRFAAYALVALYLAAAGIQGMLEPAWWWAVPVVARLPLHIRTLRRIRERSAADVVFGATFLPLEAAEAAYGVSRIRDGLHRLAHRGRRRGPAPAEAVPPFSLVDAVAVAVVALVVGVVLAAAEVGGPASAMLTATVGWAACVVTAADLVMALLRLLVAHGGPFARPGASGGSAA
ncbi:glycosyltransferase family 2 protein [Clavibacter sp. VKM Ac-2873]|uniref:glycosyltransferase family A protein n=1 Tax=Clavibacter sp. VKM Ac-2873 TaxID=2783813 RepID=UPI00188B1E45|nr:glycosyltransferase family A protein [Clavibacter sp. VKM Ac-2873]MBF4617788.1 glycosyltransferase family 2 protein [Clavibacter sp. VKM Ac-2873]